MGLYEQAVSELVVFHQVQCPQSNCAECRLVREVQCSGWCAAWGDLTAAALESTAGPEEVTDGTHMHSRLCPAVSAIVLGYPQKWKRINHCCDLEQKASLCSNHVKIFWKPVYNSALLFSQLKKFHPLAALECRGRGSDRLGRAWDLNRKRSVAKGGRAYSVG